MLRWLEEVACFCCQKSLFLACIPSWKYCARVTPLASKSGCSFWIFVWRRSVSAWQLAKTSSIEFRRFPCAEIPLTGCQSFRENSDSGGGVDVAVVPPAFGVARRCPRRKSALASAWIASVVEARGMMVGRECLRCCCCCRRRRRCRCFGVPVVWILLLSATSRASPRQACREELQRGVASKMPRRDRRISRLLLQFFVLEYALLINDVNTGPGHQRWPNR